MNYEGFIKLHRELGRSVIWQGYSWPTGRLAVTLLMMVNYEEKSWKWKGKVYMCKPGEIISSMAEINKRCGPDMTLQKLKTAIRNLIECGFIIVESTNQSSKITICNWGTYQVNNYSSNKPINKPINKQSNKRSTNQSTNQSTTIEEVQEVQESKKEKKVQEKSVFVPSGNSSDLTPPSVEEVVQYCTVDSHKGVPRAAAEMWHSEMEVHPDRWFQKSGGLIVWRKAVEKWYVQNQSWVNPKIKAMKDFSKLADLGEFSDWSVGKLQDALQDAIENSKPGDDERYEKLKEAVKVKEAFQKNKRS